MAEPQSVGERLRYVREQQGLSLDRLADKAEVSKSFLSGVENGKSGISGERLLKVANVLGASLDYLLRGQRTPGMEDLGRSRYPANWASWRKSGSSPTDRPLHCSRSINLLWPGVGALASRTCQRMIGGSFMRE